MGSWTRELRYFFRLLARSPGFTAGVVLTLALGIGANAATFAVLRTLFLKPLPYADPGRLVWVFETRPKDSLKPWPRGPVFEAWRDRQRGAFAELLVFDELTTFNLTGVGDPQRLPGERVSQNFFSLLGRPPRLGRDFAPGEDRPGADPVVILSHGLWSRQFASDPDIIGRVLSLNGLDHTVIGVMAPDFRAPRRQVDVWVPLVMPVIEWDKAESAFFVIGRLAPEATLETAQRELDRITRELQEEHPASNVGWGAEPVPLLDELVGEQRPALNLLVGAAALVWLLAVANVMHLMLARYAARRREMGLRAAIGADRARLVRQILAEGAVLGAGGAAVGLGLAWAVLHAVLAWNPGTIHRLEELRLDLHVFAFSALVAIAATLLVALPPALRASGRALAESLRGDGRTTSRRHFFLLLIAFESALVLMLVAGAFQTSKSLERLLDVELGLELDGRLSFQITLPEPRYSEPRAIARTVERMLDEIEAIPGIEATGAAMTVPMVVSWWSSAFFEGAPVPPPGEWTGVDYEAVTPGYIEALGAELLRGRDFRPGDGLESELVVIVNEKMAAEIEGEVLGHRLRVDHPEAPWRTVVGVIKNVHHDRRLGHPFWPAVWVAQSQLDYTWGERQLVAHTTLADPMALVPAIRKAVRTVDSNVPVSGFKTMQQALDGAAAGARFRARLFTLFAMVALVLGALGVYSVIAFTVSRERREVGIRLALGARPRTIAFWVLARGLRPVLLGALAGTAATLALAGVLGKMLYQVDAADPRTLTGVALFVAAVGAAATLAPALEASRIDPVELLRCE